MDDGSDLARHATSTREELLAELSASRAEVASLQHSLGLLRAVFDGVDEAIFVKDEEDRYVVVNSAAARLFGREAYGIVGSPGAERFTHDSGRGADETCPPLPGEGPPANVETITAADGRSRSFATTKIPRRDGHGRELGHARIWRDVTDRLRADAEIARQEEILRTIFDNIPVMINFLDAEGRVLLVNREWERVLGWSLEEAKVRDLVAETYPDPEQYAAVREYILNPQEGWTEFRTRVRDGRTIDTAWALVRLSDGSSIGIGLDITERKRAEGALRTSERQLRAVFDGAHDAMVIADDEGRYVDANPAACSLFGLPRSELIGRTVADFADPSLDHRRAWTEFRAAGSARGSFRLIRPDGTVRETEFAATAGILPDRHLSVLRDVTERLQAEHALRESEQRFRRVLENSRDVVYQLDLSSRTYAYISPSVRQVLGYSTEELAAEGFDLVIASLHPEDLERLKGHVTALTSPQPDVECEQVLEYRVQIPGRGWRWMSDSGSVILDDDGRPVAVVGNVRDVTDRRADADRLRELSRRLIRAQEEERRHLALELHDELGQLLTGLRLLLKPRVERSAGSHVPIPGSAVEIVDELLARIRGLSFDLRPAALDQLGLLPALLAHFERYTERTGVVVDFRHRGMERRFGPEVDSAAYRIIQEALTNVARHSGAGSVEVRAWSTADRLGLQVEDDGRGFDLGGVTAAPRSGGLSGMRERVLLLGGTLDIESERESGTLISAELPLRDERGVRDDDHYRTHG